MSWAAAASQQSRRQAVVAARRLASTATLANGATLASVPMGAGAVCSVAVSVPVGSRFETASTAGLAAVIQKAAAMDAAAALASTGAIVTGATDREATTYVATVLEADAPKAAEALAAAVSGPPSAASFAAAQAATLADASKYARTEAELIDDLHSCAYLDTRFGAPIVGTADSVEGLTSAMAADFVDATPGYKRVYACATTDASDGVAAVLEQALPALPEAAAASSFDVAPPGGGALVEPAVFTGSDKKTTYDSHPHAIIAWGYEFPTLASEWGAAATLLPFVLAGSFAGSAPRGPLSLVEPYNAHAKLTRNLAEEEAVVAAAKPFYLPYSDTALFGVYLAAKDVRIEDAMWFSTSNLVRLSFDVSESEVARAKVDFKAALAHDLASTATVASKAVADLRLVGRVVPPAELLARVEAVTLADVKNLAYKYLHDCDHGLTAVGPLHELPDYNWIRTASYNYHY